MRRYENKSRMAYEMINWYDNQFGGEVMNIQRDIDVHEEKKLRKITFCQKLNWQMAPEEKV